MTLVTGQPFPPISTDLNADWRQLLLFESLISLLVFPMLEASTCPSREGR